MKTIQAADFAALATAEIGDIVIDFGKPHRVDAVLPYNSAPVAGIWIVIASNDFWCISCEIHPPIHKYDDCTQEEWETFLSLRDKGERLEIDESMFDYWLEVIPPVAMNFPFQERTISFSFAEGDEPRTFFWREDGRIFCQNMAGLKVKNFRGQGERSKPV